MDDLYGHVASAGGPFHCPGPGARNEDTVQGRTYIEPNPAPKMPSAGKWNWCDTASPPINSDRHVRGVVGGYRCDGSEDDFPFFYYYCDVKCHAQEIKQPGGSKQQYRWLEQGRRSRPGVTM